MTTKKIDLFRNFSRTTEGGKDYVFCSIEMGYGELANEFFRVGDEIKIETNIKTFNGTFKVAEVNSDNVGYFQKNPGIPYGEANDINSGTIINLSRSNVTQESLVNDSFDSVFKDLDTNARTVAQSIVQREGQKIQDGIAVATVAANALAAFKAQAGSGLVGELTGPLQDKLGALTGGLDKALGGFAAGIGNFGNIDGIVGGLTKSLGDAINSKIPLGKIDGLLNDAVSKAAGSALGGAINQATSIAGNLQNTVGTLTGGLDGADGLAKNLGKVAVGAAVDKISGGNLGKIVGVGQALNQVASGNPAGAVGALVGGVAGDAIGNLLGDVTSKLPPALAGVAALKMQLPNINLADVMSGKIGLDTIAAKLDAKNLQDTIQKTVGSIDVNDLKQNLQMTKGQLSKIQNSMHKMAQATALTTIVTESRDRIKQIVSEAETSGLLQTNPKQVITQATRVMQNVEQTIKAAGAKGEVDKAALQKASQVTETLITAKVLKKGQTTQGVPSAPSAISPKEKETTKAPASDTATTTTTKQNPPPVSPPAPDPKPTNSATPAAEKAAAAEAKTEAAKPQTTPATPPQSAATTPAGQDPNLARTEFSADGTKATLPADATGAERAAAQQKLNQNAQSRDTFLDSTSDDDLSDEEYDAKYGDIEIPQKLTPEERKAKDAERREKLKADKEAKDAQKAKDDKFDNAETSGFDAAESGQLSENAKTETTETGGEETTLKAPETNLGGQFGGPKTSKSDYEPSKNAKKLSSRVGSIHGDYRQKYITAIKEFIKTEGPKGSDVEPIVSNFQAGSRDKRNTGLPNDGTSWHNYGLGLMVKVSKEGGEFGFDELSLIEPYFQAQGIVLRGTSFIPSDLPTEVPELLVKKEQLIDEYLASK